MSSKKKIPNTKKVEILREHLENTRSISFSDQPVPGKHILHRRWHILPAGNILLLRFIHSVISSERSKRQISQTNSKNL